MTALFLFHRDFRSVDNTSLNALKKAVGSTPIVPIFIFTPEQVTKENAYYNEKAIQFMIHGLLDITHLQTFFGDIIDVLQSLFESNTITHLGFNLDYTPYALERTRKVQRLCKRHGVEVIAEEDYTLIPLNTIRDGGYYKVFNAFYERMKKLAIPKPTRKKITFSAQRLRVKHDYRFKIPRRLQRNAGHPRLEALAILRKSFKNYDETRSIPSVETTHLSKYIKFGSVSIREVYHALSRTSKRSGDLVRQVIWHDFYAALMFYLPVDETLGGGNIQHKKITWSTNRRLFKAWCEGKTGFPIIDAGMRQLNETGWMHNRVRLLTSNFLSLLLGINWRWGERYFAQHLVDYDPSSNNLNWQFSAQVGTDRNPFLRIYNPITQEEKYDPEGVYVKRWLGDDLHTIKPIIDLAEKRKEGQSRYKHSLRV